MTVREKMIAAFKKQLTEEPSEDDLELIIDYIILGLIERAIVDFYPATGVELTEKGKQWAREVKQKL